jgi:hypothetical protein
MTRPDQEVLAEAVIHLDAAIALGVHAVQGELDAEAALWDVMRLLSKIRRRLNQEREP